MPKAGSAGLNDCSDSSPQDFLFVWDGQSQCRQFWINSHFIPSVPSGSDRGGASSLDESYRRGYFSYANNNAVFSPVV